MKTLLILSIMLTIIFCADRIVGAYYQCAMPVFAHTTACFVHDVWTGEDL